MPPGDGTRGVAHGRLRDQAARVHREERDSGARGRIDGGAELRVIVGAVQTKPAGEIDERLLLVELAQHLRGGLQRGKLAIGAEDGELAAALAERAVDDAARARSRLRRRSWFGAWTSRRSRSPVKSSWTVTSPPAVHHDGHQIGGRHLFADELLRRADGARLVGRRHGGHVEVERQQAAVGVTQIERTLRRQSAVCARRGMGATRSGQRGRGLDLFELLKLQERDGLRVCRFP